MLDHTSPEYMTQVAIEKAMREQAKERLEKDNEKAAKRNEWSEARLGRQFVKKTSSTLHLHIREFVFPPPKAGRDAGRHHIASKLLRDTGLEVETIAYLASKAVYNTLMLVKRGGVKRSTMAAKIADMVHDEWRVRVFADTKYRKALLKKLFKDFDKRAYPRAWRKKTIINYFHAQELEWSGWTKRQRIHIGNALMCIVEDNAGIIEIKGTTVYPTEALVDRLKLLMEQRSNMMMLYKPMVSKPLPWTERHLMRGNYYTNQVKRYPIIKGAGTRDVLRMVNMDWTRVLPALNALAETPWRVNRDMLEALEWSFREHGGGIGKLPKVDEEPFPPAPWDYEHNEEAAKAYNRECFLVRDRRRRAKSGRLAAYATIGLAKEFAQYDAIYFPHNLDSRGRAYPIPAFLNPQGADYVKALLEFSRGEPILCVKDADWLAIAGANAYGNDKVSLAERVEWVHSNEEMICSIANNYREDRRWMEASEPFQFLRFCFEWAQFLGEGYGFLSHMVIPVDATCSGLQHYAAMSRDEVGGKSVNLIPGFSRQDIYGDVANVTLCKMAEEGSQLARDWIKFGVDRKMTKRQVMVVPYAGKFSSCMGYTRAAMEEKIEQGYPVPWDTENTEVHTEHLVYLSKHIWDSITDVVVKGKEVMQWLSKTASTYAKAMNKTGVTGYAARMTWVTPDGFEVSHYREETKKSQIRTSFDGTVQLVDFEGTGRLDPSDMGLAVAPNFVHSLDATHLRMTIIKALELGITDFGMVHDSFGVHASHMSRFLSEAVKPAFVELYQTDVLEEFADRYRGVIPVEPVPSKGSLDLEGVLRSEFFFS